MNRRVTYFLAAIIGVLALALAFTVPALVNAKNDAVCEAVNKNATTIRGLVGPEPQVFPVPEGSDPALREALETANARAIKSWHRVQARTRHLPC